MAQQGVCRSALLRYIPEHLLQNSEQTAGMLRAGHLQHLLEVRVLPLGPCALEVGQPLNPWPRLRGRSALDPEDLKQRVDLRVPGEKGGCSAHLRQDATQGPHVHGVSITALVSLKEHQLWRSVPQRDDELGEGARSDIQRQTASSQAEVRHLQRAGLHVHQDVLWLQVTMNVPAAVAAVDALQDLTERHSRLGAKGSSEHPPHVIPEVHVHELHDDVHAMWNSMDTEHLHDVGVLARRQRCDFANGKTCHTFLTRQGGGLHGHVFAGHQV
mmetsp:Transcript_60023/g.140295  ORF Transcript_60023/g.140295 Transcript_60023/m.140295 type:complete len:271 (+) Transcript_60023:157-969(+)